MVQTAPSPDFSRLADNLRLLRLARRKTQRELAAETGLSQGYICRLERHLWPSDVGHVDRLAEALSVEPRHLLRKSSFRRLVRADSLQVIVVEHSSAGELNTSGSTEGGPR